MPIQRGMNLILQLYRTSNGRQWSLFLSPKLVKQVFKLAEHLQESIRIISAQFIAWNKNEKFTTFQFTSYRKFCPHFFTNTRINVGKKEHTYFFLSFYQLNFNNSRPFQAIISTIRAGKFYCLLLEKDNTKQVLLFLAFNILKFYDNF